MKDRRCHRLAGWVVLFAAALAIYGWRQGWGIEDLRTAWAWLEIFLRERPVWLFLAIVLLPGLPFPTTALMFLAGTVWRDRPVAACAVCLLALALNMSWTYWLAAKPGRGWVEKLLAAGTLRVPELPRGNHLRMLLILRLTPGVPLFLQNYLLGFFRVPFRLYLLVSIACSGLIACGIVLSGAGVAGGNFTPAITGVGLIVVGLIVVQAIRARMLRAEGKVDE